MRRSTSAVRRACAVGTTVALIGLTTGLGIMTATSASAVTGDEPVSTTTTAPAAGGTSSDAGTPATGTDAGDPPAGGSDTSIGDAGSDAGTGSTDTGIGAGTDPVGSGADTGAGTGTGSDSGSGSASNPSGDSSDGRTTDEPGAAQTTPASSPTGTSSDQPTGPAAITRAAARQTVSIEGDLTVGSDLVAKPVGFTPRSKVSYLWTDESGAELSDTASYTIGTALAGKTITVTVEGDVPGEEAEATTTAVAPVFVGENGKPLSDEDGEGDPYIEAKAGEVFSYTFRALSTPAPTLSITWFDDDGDPRSTLPAGVRFDPATGVLSGTLTEADNYYDFTVTATVQTASGPVSTEQYGSVSVEAGLPAGIEVYSADRDGIVDGTSTTVWIIRPNGDVYTVDALAEDGEPVKGGRVTVAQGGTLLVAGYQVDRFGNEILPDFDDETGEPVFFTPTVTSDVATDVIGLDPELGDAGVVSVTFPHASTHTLTVSGASVLSTVFAVDVRPTVVPAVVPAPPVVPAAVTAPQVHQATGRLAYTGADETAPLAWALGLLVAGAGLIGARTLRRRRAQR